MKLFDRLFRRKPAECMRVAEVLQAYLDGEVDAPTAAEVSAHLEACRDCGLEASAYEDLKVSLGRHQDPDPDALARLRSFVDELADKEQA
ncbi:MAG: anti-sigma factor [Actinomycetota bacterium]